MIRLRWEDFLTLATRYSRTQSRVPKLNEAYQHNIRSSAVSGRVWG